MNAADSKAILDVTMQENPDSVRRLILTTAAGVELPLTGYTGRYGGSRMAVTMAMTNDADAALWCPAPKDIASEPLLGCRGLLVDAAGTEATARTMRVASINPTPDGGLWRLDLINEERAAK